MNTPVREGETIEGSRTMRNRPYQVTSAQVLKSRSAGVRMSSLARAHTRGRHRIRLPGTQRWLLTVVAVSPFSTVCACLCVLGPGLCFCVKGGRDRNSALCVEAEKRRFLAAVHDRTPGSAEPAVQPCRAAAAHNARARPGRHLLRGKVFATGLNKTTIMREAGAPVCMREASSVAEAAKCLSRVTTPRRPAVV